MPTQAARIAAPPAARQAPANGYAGAPQHPLPTRAKPRKQTNWLLIGLIAAPLMFVAVLGFIVVLGAVFIFGGSTALPGVSAAGVALGGLSADEAAQVLSSEWTLSLSDGERLVPVDGATFGITLDAAATAAQAVSYGRQHGDLLLALMGDADVPPVMSIDLSATEQGLQTMRALFEQAPVNAGITLVNGTVQAHPGVMGKALDLNATLAPIRQNAAAALADGVLEIVMMPVAPQVSDATALVQAAGALLANPLQIRLYDPIDNSGQLWNVSPETWSTWLVANGNDLTFDAAQVNSYLTQKQAELPAGDYLDAEASVAALQASIARRETSASLRIYHREQQHVVQSGESLIGIAWDYGMPYPWIQAANPGVDTLSVGQSITIPSADEMLPLPIVPNKRIVVSISEQRVRVYENGALKWDWLGSTGITSSPTWRGVYQIISHETNAYASNWDLWMPNFMGVYRPVPGADFVNGFHGFPTRGSSQLLWTNSLGTKVTYGCILLSNENAQALYNWAEEGVVVEITG
jgi:lipoprotein-anchoring transpeptidase ErfK/SrfK